MSTSRHSVQSGTEAPEGSCETFGSRIPLIRQFGSREFVARGGGCQWRRQGAPLHGGSADGARSRQGRGVALHRRQRGEGGCAVSSRDRKAVACRSAQGKAPAAAASSHRPRRWPGGWAWREACGRREATLRAGTSSADVEGSAPRAPWGQRRRPRAQRRAFRPRGRAFRPSRSQLGPSRSQLGPSCSQLGPTPARADPGPAEASSGPAAASSGRPRPGPSQLGTARVRRTRASRWHGTSRLASRSSRARRRRSASRTL